MESCCATSSGVASRCLRSSHEVCTSSAARPTASAPRSASALRLERQAPLLRLDEPGFYQVHQATPADIEITLAANVDPGEANPERLDVDRFVEDIRASAEPPSAVAAPTRRQAAGYEREQQLWYAILAAALALMLIEALCANWIGIRRSLRGVQAG